MTDRDQARTPPSFEGRVEIATRALNELEHMDADRTLVLLMLSPSHPPAFVHSGYGGSPSEPDAAVTMFVDLVTAAGMCLAGPHSMQPKTLHDALAIVRDALNSYPDLPDEPSVSPLDLTQKTWERDQ